MYDASAGIAIVNLAPPFHVFSRIAVASVPRQIPWQWITPNRYPLFWFLVNDRIYRTQAESRFQGILFRYRKLLLHRNQIDEEHHLYNYYGLEYIELHCEVGYALSARSIQYPA